MLTLRSPHATRDDYEDAPGLFAQLADLSDGDAARAKLREQLITRYLPVAHRIAARFSNRGISRADLNQVAAVGLIKAVDRFESDRGKDFLSFAVPTIMGEVRRHFRDNAWSMRVPRPLQELHLSISHAIAELSQRTGTSPTPREIAQHLDLPVETVYEGLQVAHAYRSDSLDHTSRDETGSRVSDSLGEDDPNLADVENKHTIEPMLRALPERERRIVILRYFGNMTQLQIAELMGISQMHVSRLLAKSLATLRKQVMT